MRKVSGNQNGHQSHGAGNGKSSKTKATIMSELKTWGASIRKLAPMEVFKFRDHLLRLDKDSRRLRFAHGVSDSFIEKYASGMNDDGSIVFGYFEGNEVRAAAELRKLGRDKEWGDQAEAAFSVERNFQEKGLGSELMARVIRSARNRNIKHLFLSCLAENGKMLSIAKKHDASLHFEFGEVTSDIVPQEANYFSLMAEAVEDRVGYMMAVLDLQRRQSEEADKAA
jgi:GNAT superfamily N-acetyltransferase